MSEDNKVVYMGKGDWKLDKIHDDIIEVLEPLSKDYSIMTIIGLLEVVKQNILDI